MRRLALACTHGAMVVLIVTSVVAGCGGGGGETGAGRFAGRWVLSWQDPEHLVVVPGASEPSIATGTIDLIVSLNSTFAGSIGHPFLGFAQTSASLPIQGLFTGSVSANGDLSGTIQEPDSPTLLTVSGHITVGAGENTLSGSVHLSNGANPVSTLEVSGTLSRPGATARFAGSYAGDFSQSIPGTQGGAVSEHGTLSILVRPDRTITGTAHGETNSVDAAVTGALNDSGVMNLTLTYPASKYTFAGIASPAFGTSVHAWLADTADQTGAGQFVADITPL